MLVPKALVPSHEPESVVLPVDVVPVLVVPELLVPGLVVTTQSSASKLSFRGAVVAGVSVL